MKNKRWIIALATGLMAVAVAMAVDFNANTTGDWDVGANWSGGAKPGATGDARIGPSPSGVLKNNSVVTLDTQESINRFIFGQGGTGCSLTVAFGGSLTTTSTTDHRFGQTSAFTVNLEAGGKINVSNAKITSDAGGIFNINGGDFDTKSYSAGTGSSAAVNVKGSTASIDIADTSTFGAFATLSFDFNGGNSVSTWNTVNLDILDGAILDIAGGSALGIGTYDLLSYSGTLAGSFTAGTITGLGNGLSGSIQSDGDSIFLNVAPVPEPATAAILLGLAALGLVVLRGLGSFRKDRKS